MTLHTETALPDAPEHPREKSGQTGSTGFHISQNAFAGPFDLLLSLIAKHKLDITDVSLALVTDEFIAYLKNLPGQTKQQLEETSQFLVVAATLLDMKLARLLPQGEAVNEEDIHFLEARDLLFARLLQYRAFKQLSGWFADRLQQENVRRGRAIGPDGHLTEVTPAPFKLDARQLWQLAQQAFSGRAGESLTSTLKHLHAPRVSLREQAAIVIALLRGRNRITFTKLTAGVREKPVFIARFLVVLELYRNGSIKLQQDDPLGEITVALRGRVNPGQEGNLENESLEEETPQEDIPASEMLDDETLASFGDDYV